MRHGWAWSIGLLTLSLVGCTSSQPVRSTSLLDRLRQIGSGPIGPDVVQIDVALIERPLGDPYLNTDLWSVADEQVVSLERRAILEDNGFRVGQLGGITPAELQALLTSDRSCANPRRILLHAGKPATLVLGPTSARCRFQMERDGDLHEVALEQAQCVLEAVPTLTPDGRTRLLLTPVVRHGEATLLPRPTADRTSWMLQEQRPTERYAALSWEVTVAPNEYLVIGARCDREQTLGCAAFLSDGERPVQRLLVVRTNRSQPEAVPEPLSGNETEALPPRSPPLACQAVWSTARGVAP